MKNTRFLLLLLAIFVTTACNQDSLLDKPEVDYGSTSIQSAQIRKSSIYSHNQENTSVSIDDINFYLSFKQLSAKHDGDTIKVVSIIPFEGESDTPSGYFINYDEGWELISGDKRTPCVLAMSPTGNINPHDLPDEIWSWFLGIEEKIDILKSSKEINDTHSSNLLFWKAISADKDFVGRIHSSLIETRSPGDPIIDPLLPGHWELVNVSTGWIIIENIPHLIQTNWHQESPYNNFSPERNNNYTGRAPAGCLAIAGAQLLYYYHYKNGIPECAPSQGSVSGVVNGYIQQDFGGYNQTIWNSMIAVPDSASFLVGSVGKAVHMHYGNFVSQAQMDSLITCVMNPLSINSTYYPSYNKNAVIQSLRNANPVLIRAGKNSSSTDYGHIFLIDHYRRFQRRTTYEYLYVYDIDPEEMQPIAPSYVEYEYHDTFSDWIGMNWGLGGNYNQFVYEDDDSWIVETAPGYDYHKRMYVFNN